MVFTAVEKEVVRCAQLIEESNYICALTGAGISTSAGVPDFRGPKGLYVTRRYDPDTVFDINYFLQDPKPFYDFTRDFIALEAALKPTKAHYFLTNLEERGKLKGVITQNIDLLHKRAGTKNVLELHGSYWESFCLTCRRAFSYSEMKEKIQAEEIPHCPCGGVIKPDVVFFGENVKHLNEAFTLAEASDLFFVIGTSCVVQPAASIPALSNGKIIVVNRDPVFIDGANIEVSVQTDIDTFFNSVSQLLLKEGVSWGKSS